jgi:D-apionolactonase
MSSWRALDPRVPLRVAAGGATLTVVNGTVRWIAAGGTETVRGIYGAVRDPNWATIQPVFTTYEGDIQEDAFTIRFQAQCVRPGDVDVAWEGTIAGGADGSVTFTFDGLCRSSFMTPRIGLCVLHPPRLAGQPVEVDTLFGTLHARFPDLITQYMPFSNMVGMRHDADTPHETNIGFEGDLFETEDQRAFTDASYKTFSRPLEMPRPYKVDTGTVVRQVVTVRHPHLPAQDAAAVGPAAGPSAWLHIGAAAGAAMPSIGACLPPADLLPNARVTEAVRSLGLAHLRASIAVDSPDALAEADRAASEAAAVGAALEVLLVGASGSPGLDAAVAHLAQVGVPLARLMAVDPAGNTTTAPLAAQARQALRASGLEVPLVGGSRGYLYQLISRGVPGNDVDIVSFPTNPQVHAFDEASMVETLEALPAGVRTAAALAGGKPVAVAPVSLRPLFNPDLVGPEAPPPPGALPWRYDERQVTPFAAAWTLGCVAAFAAAGVVSLTLHEAAGWGGLVAANHAALPEMPFPPGSVLPVGHVMAALAALAGHPLRTLEASTGIHALAVDDPGGIRLVVANLSFEACSVALEVAGSAPRVRTALQLVPDPLDGATWRPFALEQGQLALPADGVAALLLERA